MSGQPAAIVMWNSDPRVCLAWFWDPGEGEGRLAQLVLLFDGPRSRESRVIPRGFYHYLTFSSDCPPLPFGVEYSGDPQGMELDLVPGVRASLVRMRPSPIAFRWEGPEPYLDRVFRSVVPEGFRHLRDAPSPSEGDGVRLALYLAGMLAHRVMPPVAWSERAGVAFRLFGREVPKGLDQMEEIAGWVLAHPDFSGIREEFRTQWGMVRLALEERG